MSTQDFSEKELETKLALQRSIMDIFGYVYLDSKKRPHEEQEAGAVQWAMVDGGENARMAKLFSDICASPEIRAQLSGGITESLVQEVKSKMEKLFYPEIYQGEQPESRAA